MENMVLKGEFAEHGRGRGSGNGGNCTSEDNNRGGGEGFGDRGGRGSNSEEWAVRQAAKVVVVEAMQVGGMGAARVWVAGAVQAMAQQQGLQPDRVNDTGMVNM